ncbi:hypothetical protein [Nocardiopsis quinghaiensis]|uniref:hypothetical protein n=1 Tax=Nocardiopsis quinghaiensis TaxID=464995 RepID=UPI00123BEA55|nr:hypothetical protein [Nocardiopsis quinghaiensis]
MSGDPSTFIRMAGPMTTATALRMKGMRRPPPTRKSSPTGLSGVEAPTALWSALNLSVAVPDSRGGGTAGTPRYFTAPAESPDTR